ACLSLLPFWPSISPGEKSARSSSISSFMSAAVLGAEARFLPDVVGSWAALMACASSGGGAARDAACLACLAACAASACISTAAAQSKAAMQGTPAARLPIRKVPSIGTTPNDPKDRECQCRRGEGQRRLGCAKTRHCEDVI